MGSRLTTCADCRTTYDSDTERCACGDQCPDCNDQDGVCQECDGGDKNCRGCDGSGKCGTCGGAGVVLPNEETPPEEA